MKVKPSQQNIKLRKSEHKKTAAGKAFATQLQKNIPSARVDTEEPADATRAKTQDREHIGNALHQIANALEAIAAHEQGMFHPAGGLENISRNIDSIHSKHPLVQDAKALIATEIARLKRQI